jgi:transcriptional regulator with XRE-family HTH domain
MNEPLKTLGQHMRDLREKNDLSLRELAKKVGVSAAFLSDIELGRRHPSEKVMAAIADALGTTAEKLAKYDTRPPMEELRRRAAADPTFAIALRRFADERRSPEDLIKLLKK